MPVTSTANIAIYALDGVLTNFFFPYYVVRDFDIRVTSQVNLIEYRLGTDFSILELPDAYGAFPTGLTVHFFVAPVISEAKILITRKTEISNLTQFIDNDPFAAETLNHALDKLTVALQDADPGIFANGSFKGASFGPPTAIDIQYTFGDWFKNVMPQAIGEPFGWVCVFTGLPGTWEPFGIIARA